MNNSVETAVINAMREMVTECPLVKITVLGLCERAKISRRAFYDHFDDKRAVLDTIFYEDVLVSTEKMTPLFTREMTAISSPFIYELMLRGIYNNRDFYIHLASRENENYFRALLIKSFSDIHYTLATQITPENTEELRYASRFVGGGTGDVILAWIQDGMKTPVKELAQWVSEWGRVAALIGFE